MQLAEDVYLMDASPDRSTRPRAYLGSTLEDEEGEFETLAGFVTHHFGDIPLAGAEFEHEGWTFKVEVADERRVSKVLVSKTQSEQDRAAPAQGGQPGGARPHATSTDEATP